MRINKNILIISILFLVVLLFLVFGWQKFFLRPKEVYRAKVAIVIDDWGYNSYYINFIREINVPLTISILPNLRYSAEIAKITNNLGKEVILHLPLEPEIKEGEYIGLEKNTITTQMSKDEVINNFRLALTCLSNVSGVSNHMGSRATQDSKLMATIFTELKQRKLFFLDNLVTDKSICRELAQKMKVKFSSRGVFLDNEVDEKYINGQLEKLSSLAKANGQAIGIGHVRLKTLKVLKDKIPSMQEKGIKFVFVSELTE